MGYCPGCHFPITDLESTKRRQWCQSIRRLLILKAIQPEDYHEDCFMDVLLRKKKLLRPLGRLGEPGRGDRNSPLYRR